MSKIEEAKEQGFSWADEAELTEARKGVVIPRSQNDDPWAPEVDTTVIPF